MIEGKMLPGRKYRGKISHIIPSYINNLSFELENADRSRVFIVHSGIDIHNIDTVRNKLQNEYCFEEIIIAQAGCVISSHCGPGAFGVMFIEN